MIVIMIFESSNNMDVIHNQTLPQRGNKNYTQFSSLQSGGLDVLDL